MGVGSESAVVSASSHEEANVHEHFAKLKAAFDAGRVNPRAITRPVIRAALRALSEVVGVDNLRTDLLDNPFDSPHNLNWYLGLTRAPAEVRLFLKGLNKGSVRVWSAVNGGTDAAWRVLAQVHGQDARAADVLMEAAKVSARRFKLYGISGSAAYGGRVYGNKPPASAGFAELTLARIPSKTQLGYRDGAHQTPEGRIPHRSNLPSLRFDGGEK